MSGEDRTLLRDIERLIGKQIEQKVIAGFEPGSGYQHAQPEPQQRRGQRPHSQPRRPEKSRSAQRSQGSGQRSQGNGQGRPMRPMRGPQPSSQPRQGQGPRRDHGRDRPQGRRQDQQRAPITPMDKDLIAVREQQLEYHRKQMAEENEQPKEKKASALFGWLGRKVDKDKGWPHQCPS